MEYRLTSATSEDKAWLDRLRRAAYQDLFVATWGGWDEVRHLRHFAQCWEGGHIYILELQDERVGMLQVFENDDAVEISEIQIQPSHQGKGIGAQLLRDTIAQAHVRRKRVLLSTGLRNLGAVRLYERLGFRHVCRSETHIQMESRPDMALTVGAVRCR